MSKLLVDTNIIVDYTHSANTILRDLFGKQINQKVQLYISLLTITEFLTGIDMENLDSGEKSKKLLENFEVTTPNKTIAYIAATLLRKKYTQLIADAYIAATCLYYNFELVTRNIKHFKNIPGLKIYTV